MWTIGVSMIVLVAAGNTNGGSCLIGIGVHAGGDLLEYITVHVDGISMCIMIIPVMDVIMYMFTVDGYGVVR